MAALGQPLHALGMMKAVPALDEEGAAQVQLVQQSEQSRVADSKPGSIASGVLAMPSAISRARPMLSNVRQSVPAEVIAGSLTLRMLWTVAAASLIAGLLIGLTGIGGVLLVPVLTQIARVPLDRAIAASLLGLLFAGIYAAFVHLRRARLECRPVAVLCLAATTGALVGAVTLDRLPATAVRLFVALLALGSGLHALASKHPPGGNIPSSSKLGMLGLAAGYGSAISGTGGPVILIPLLLALRTPVAPAIALGLAAQLPIALTATVVYAIEGRIDLPLGATLGALLIAGTFAGALLSRRLSGRGLTVAVALTLIAVGLWYGYATLVSRA